MQSIETPMTRIQFERIMEPQVFYRTMTYFQFSPTQSNPRPSNITKLILGDIVPEQIQCIYQSCPFLKHLQINNFVEDALEENEVETISKLPLLQSLSIYSSKQKHTCKRLLQKLPNLKSIDLYVYFQDTQKQLLDNLKLIQRQSKRFDSISLRFRWQFPSFDLTFQQLLKIQHLKCIAIYYLFNWTVLTDENIDCLTQNRHLESLELYDIIFKNPNEFIESLSKYKNLNTLQIYNGNIESDHLILFKSDKITKLVLRHKTFTEHQLKVLAQNFPSLTDISLTGLRIDDGLFHILLNKFRLKSLCIERFETLDCTLQSFFVFPLPLIKISISIQTSKDIRYNKWIKTLSVFCPDLQEIVFCNHSCSFQSQKISNNGLMYLKKLKKLTSIKIGKHCFSHDKLLGLFRGLKGLMCFCYDKYGIYVGTKKTFKKFDENTKMSTKVWVRNELFY